MAQPIYPIENLELLAKQVVEGFIIGLHKSPFHGFSVEFAEHRLYNQGDNLKHIDWKVYGRSDKLFIKKFEEETNLRCQIVIDTSSSMLFPEDNNVLNKLQFSCMSAASLITLLKKQLDAVGITLFDDDIYYHSNAKSNTAHTKILINELEKLLNKSEKQHSTQAVKCLHQIAESIHKRSMVIIFSDMFDSENDEELFNALQHLKYNKHEVILFHVADKQKELDFNFENRPYEFVDLENGEKLKLQPSEVRDFYLSQMQHFYKQLKLKCGQYKIEFVEADINNNYQQILQTFLLKRTKMM